MRLARLLHFLHHHHRGQIFEERTPLLPKLRQLPVSIANHIRSMVVKKIACEFALLSNIPRFRREDQDFRHCLRNREQLDFHGCQISPINPDVIHATDERTLPAADSQWLGEQCECLIEPVQFHVQRNWLTIDVDANPIRQT